jgi:hypothetical protein
MACGILCVSRCVSFVAVCGYVVGSVCMVCIMCLMCESVCL